MQSGYELKCQIDIHEILKGMYISEKDYLIKHMLMGPTGYKTSIEYSGMPKGSGLAGITLDRQMDRLGRLQDQIDLEQVAINNLSNSVMNINIKIQALKGTASQVIFLRDYEGLSLQVIADRLYLSLSRIKQISCRHPR